MLQLSPGPPQFCFLIMQGVMLIISHVRPRIVFYTIVVHATVLLVLVTVAALATCAMLRTLLSKSHALTVPPPCPRLVPMPTS